MKKFTMALKSIPFFRGLLLLVLLLITIDLQAVTAKIHGPSQVCPLQPYTFTAEVRNVFGSIITPDCWSAWHVLRNGNIIANGYGSSFTYTFGETLGSVDIRLHVATGAFCAAETMVFKSVEIRVVGPQNIDGPTAFCYDQSQTYEAFIPYNEENCNFHYKYVWTIPNGWSISDNNSVTAFSTTITAPARAVAGTYQIKVKGWYDDRGYYTPEKVLNVYLGPPNTSGVTIYGPSIVCPNTTTYYVVDAVAGATDNNWTWPSDWTYLSGQGTRYLELKAPNHTYSGGPYLPSVGVTVTNPCSSPTNSTPVTMQVNVQSTGCNTGPIIYSVYPNPSADSFEVSIEDKDYPEGKDISGPIELTLINEKQNAIRYTKSTQNKVKIETSDLPNGIYYLHIRYNGKTEVKQVIVRK